MFVEVLAGNTSSGWMSTFPGGVGMSMPRNRSTRYTPRLISPRSWACVAAEMQPAWVSRPPRRLLGAAARRQPGPAGIATP